MMKRRNFISLSSLAVFGTTMKYRGIGFGPSFAFTGNDSAYLARTPGYKIHSDGRFDITSGTVLLRGCYPVIDERQVTPVKTENGLDQEGQYILYTLDEGTITLRFQIKENRLLLKSRLTGFSTLPYWFKPLGYGEVSGADRFYKQGFGFAGPSGVFPFPAGTAKIEGDRLKEEAWSYDSYLVSGLLADDGETLGWTVSDNHRFLHRTTFFNRYHRFGLIDRHLQIDRFFVDAGFSTENIKAAENTDLPDISFMAGKPPYETFRNLMKVVAADNGISTLKPPGYLWCSWYEFGKDFSFDILHDFVTGMKKMKNPPEIQAIQIDDGYCERGDWLIANDKWPGGIEKAVQFIKKNGFVSGLWVGPFMVGRESLLYRDHRDWLLRDRSGQIIDENGSYILDTSHPEAFEYLRHVFHTLYSYGIRYYKTDFMDWGYQDSTLVRRYTPGKTSAEYYHDVISMIREEIHDDSFWLGCISPFQPVVGFVDAVRVANDVQPGWNGGSTLNMFREMWSDQIFNNILWQNDPDVLYLRDTDSKFTSEEKYSVALFDGFTGGVVDTSDRFNILDEQSLRLWQMLKPGVTHLTATPLEWDQPDGILKMTRTLSETLLAYFAVNTSAKEDSLHFDPYAITGWSQVYLYIFVPGTGFRPSPASTDQMLKLKPHGSVLLYVSDSVLNDPDRISLSGIKIN